MTVGDVDPVALVAGSARPPETYRCRRCSEIGTYPAVLPVGGVPCRGCGEPIMGVDVVTYPSALARVLSLLGESAILLPPLLTAWFTLNWLIIYFAPTDYPGHITPTAAVWARTTTILVMGIPVFGYFWLGNARGQTYGRRFTGTTVVNADTGSRLGWGRGLMRTIGQLSTIATMGIGYLPVLVDSRRRALHDWIAGSVIVEL